MFFLISINLIYFVGFAAIHLAALYNKDRVILVLVAYGAKIDKKVSFASESILNTLLKNLFYKLFSFL